jgi:hypothetical protein
MRHDKKERRLPFSVMALKTTLSSFVTGSTPLPSIAGLSVIKVFLKHCTWAIFPFSSATR